MLFDGGRERQERRGILKDAEAIGGEAETQC